MKHTHLFYARHRNDGALVVPRGAQMIVRDLARAHGVAVEIVDQTHLAPPVAFDERVTLSEAQEEAVAAALARRGGVIEAPAGSGKTIMGLVAVARRGQPALWVTHTRELARQAVERAGMVLGLTPDEIGFVGDGQCTVGALLTVALVQTLARAIPPALLDVGHLIVDECHHTPADQLSTVVARIPARYVLGLTATPYRRDKLDRVISWYLGPIVARIDKEDLADRLITPAVVKRDTGLRLFGDTFTGLVSDLADDPARNRLIVADVAAVAAMGRRCLILSDRVGHVGALAALLTAAGVASAALHGQLGKRKRAEVIAGLAAGDLRAVVATGSLVGEGFDAPGLDTLFLATPVSYGGRVVQYLGRVSRTAPGKSDALVVDYCDDHPMLWASYRNRKVVYVAQGCAISSSPARTAARMRRGGRMSHHATEDDESFTVLHSRARLAENGAPAMTERLLSSLDDRPARSRRVRLPTGGLTLAEGRRRLGVEYPDLSACLERCCVGSRRQTTREAAAALGLSAATVCNRKRWRRRAARHLVRRASGYPRGRARDC